MRAKMKGGEYMRAKMKGGEYMRAKMIGECIVLFAIVSILFSSQNAYASFGNTANSEAGIKFTVKEESTAQISVINENKHTGGVKFPQTGEKNNNTIVIVSCFFLFLGVKVYRPKRE